MAIDGIGSNSYIYNSCYESKAAKSKTNNDTEETKKEEDKEFKNVGELMSYLKEHYNVVKKGMAEISGSYLRDCLKDKGKLKDLYDMMDAADQAEKNAKNDIEGYQGMRITIDKDGNMTYETWGGKVAFNEAKRARQLASAKTPEQIRMLLSILNKDLAECKDGASKGMCDEAEVAKVEAMLQKAQQRMSEIAKTRDKGKETDDGSFFINMLM